MFLPFCKANVLIDQNMQPRIADFGSSIFLGEERTTDIPIPITPWWTAPEALYNNFSRASDVWSFGMTALELLSDTKPYNGLNRFQAMYAIDAGNLPQRPEGLGLNEELWTLCCDCWQRDPVRRPSIRHLHERLVATARGEHLMLH